MSVPACSRCCSRARTHAVVYGYGAPAPGSRPSRAVRALLAYDSHRGRRDQLTALLPRGRARTRRRAASRRTTSRSPRPDAGPGAGRAGSRSELAVRWRDLGRGTDEQGAARAGRRRADRAAPCAPPSGAAGAPATAPCRPPSSAQPQARPRLGVSRGPRPLVGPRQRSARRAAAGQRATSATTAPVSRTRSAGASSTDSPRRPRADVAPCRTPRRTRRRPSAAACAARAG